MGVGRPHRAEARRGRLAWWSFLSVASHVAVFLLANEIGFRGCGSSQISAEVIQKATRGRATAPVEVALLEPRPLVPGARSIEAELEAEREKKIEEARKEEETATGQIVEMAKPHVEIRPEQARFSSEYDVKVEKETKAVGRPGVRAPGGPPQPPEAAADPGREGKVGAPGETAPTPATAPGRMAMRPRLGTVDPTQPDGSAKGQVRPDAPGGEMPRVGAMRPASPRPTSATPTGEGGEGGEAGQGGPPRPTALSLDDETYSKTIGSGSIDHLKDIDEGQETLLNTRRNRYAGFFNRMKRSVAAEWHPERTYSMRDPSGQIYGVKNRYTVLKVVLKPDGSMHAMAVEKPSGVDFLDEEALSAFNAAQPFPNPPAGLVDPDSRLITFRFGFYFEIDRSPGIRVIWQ
jgi:TonB family protein